MATKRVLEKYIVTRKMKNTTYWIILLLCLFIFPFSAKSNTDSLTFEAQRTTVNNLLDARANKFGEYVTSLDQKTGIFGLFKTSRDMQKSIDILQSIVLTDNKIFIETRKLLSIKDNQAEKYQHLALKYDNQVTAYMKTISKLQATNDKLRLQLKDLENGGNSYRNISFLLTIVIIALLVAIFMLYRHKSAKN